MGLYVGRVFIILTPGEVFMRDMTMTMSVMLLDAPAVEPSIGTITTIRSFKLFWTMIWRPTTLTFLPLLNYSFETNYYNCKYILIIYSSFTI